MPGATPRLDSSAEPGPSAQLSDREFHERADSVLSAIEATLDRWLQEDEIDIDSQRTGGLLELVFPGGSKIVVNTQPPLHELWLAARTGGYHFRFVGGRWIDSRSGGEFFAMLSREISAQAGTMVGVDKEERLATPWTRSLKFRHPWLQLNLLTAFLAAAVVGAFQGTIDRLVILAMFLPVLAGQSGNTGCQALAVTLRGMTLGELKPGAERRLVSKEAWLGCLNGVGVGVAAGVGMFITAAGQHQARPFMLGFVVFLAMIGACVASGVSGALVPLTLKRLGFDPATASSIFLTTATDVVSMGMLLGLAALLVS